MKRFLPLIAIVVVLIAIAAFTIRIQPAAQARITRSGDSIGVHSSRVAFVMPGGAQCTAPFANGLARFDRAFDTEDAGGETIKVAVRFDYTVPERVPASWPEGDWCASLASRIEQLAQASIAQADVERLRRDPRALGELVAKELAVKLADLHPRSLTFRPTVPESALASLPVADIASEATKTKPVIFIGLDGADWQLLDSYMQRGLMPNLQSLVREGTAGDLLTEHPPLSPLLWTTMMTGRSPLEHEILDFTRFHPASGQKEPITSDERKVPAIWNMATQAGKDVAVFGLWATYPAEPVRGLLVSDRFFTFLFSESTPPKGTVHPPAREAWARKTLNDVESGIGYGIVTQYVTVTGDVYAEHAKAADPYSHPISALRRILVETEVYDRLAKQTIESKTPDLTIVYFQGTDSIGHMFAPYTAPRQPHISEADFERYSKVPEKYFAYVDRLLGGYKELAKKHGARLMIASDHGFHWFEGRPTELSSFAASTAAKWHRKAGVYLLWGEGIAARGRTGAEQHIAQVAPTLLALGGMPSDPHLSSAPILVPASSARADYAQHFTPMQAPAAPTGSSNEELAKLKALGYIGSSEATSAPAGVAGKSTHTAGWYNNRGLILKERKQNDAAIESFEQSIQLDPNLASALWNYSDLLVQMNRELDRADALLVRAFQNDLPEGRKFLIGRAIGYQRNGAVDRSLKLLEQAVAAKPDDVEIRVFRGRYRIEQQDCAGALADFEAAIRLNPDDPIPHASAGIAQVCLGHPDEAKRHFARSLAIDPNQPRLQAFLRQQR